MSVRRTWNCFHSLSCSARWLPAGCGAFGGAAGRGAARSEAAASAVSLRAGAVTVLRAGRAQKIAWARSTTWPGVSGNLVHVLDRPYGGEQVHVHEGNKVPAIGDFVVGHGLGGLG